MKPALALVVIGSTCLLAACSSSPLASLAASGGAAGVSVAPAGATAAPSGSPVAPPSLATDWVDYPPGPYGSVRGATIANLEFLGWRHPDTSNYDNTNFDKLRLSDFYNPDGRSDLKLLAVNASAVWCSVCRAEYADMNSNGTYATYRAEGVEFLGTLFQDNSDFPAQPADLTRWGSDATHAVKFPLVLDPGFKMGAFFDSDATPLNMVIDLRTMTIVSVTMGYATTYWSSVQTLLNKL